MVALALTGASLFGGLWAAVPQVGRSRSVQPFARYLQTHMREGEALFSYRDYPQTLPVYIQRPIGVVAFEGELAFGVSRLPEVERIARFPSPREFKPLWDSDRRVYLVTDRKCLAQMEGDGLGHATLLMERRIVLLLTNRPVQGTVHGHP